MYKLNALLNTHAFGGYTWMHVMLTVGALMLVSKGITRWRRSRFKDPNAVKLRCPSCLWKGRVSKFTRKCPNCATRFV